MVNGFTLVEILTALAISSVIAFFAMDLVLNSFKFLNRAQANADIQQDFSLLHGFLQQRLASDIKMYAFTGTSDRVLGRMILPAPGRCADLSTCDGQEAFLFASNSRQAKDGFSLICAIPDAGGDGLTLLMDGHAPPPQGFDSLSAGKIVQGANQTPLAVGQLISSESIPIATLFTVIEGPKIAPLSGGYGALRYGGANVVGLSDCELNLQPDGAGGFLLDRVVQIRVQPYYTADFTGGPTRLTSASVLTYMGDFPQTLRPAQIFSIGTIRPSPSGSPQGVVAVPCSIDGNSKLTCGGQNTAQIDKYQLAGTLFTYAVQLNGVPDGIELQLPVIGGETLLPNLCPPTVCSTLATGALGSFKALASSSESFEALDGTTFSLFKQDGLIRVRFSLISPEQKLENFTYVLRTGQ